ncbi:MAG: helix-turn-helix domain-containing protein [Chloroflexota bacterium]
MSHPTYDSLIDAGFQLAEEHGLAAMSVNDVVERAGVAKGTFYVHFPNRTAYLIALHRSFHDDLKVRILEATQNIPPGAERLRVGVEAYLDGCLDGRAVKALLFDARGENAIREEVQRRNVDFAQLVQDDFAAMGDPYAAKSARLAVAMGAEAALIELESGGRDDDMRAALIAFVQR